MQYVLLGIMFAVSLGIFGFLLTQISWMWIPILVGGLAALFVSFVPYFEWNYS